MLELLLVFPLVILLLMSFVQVSEIVVAGMGVEWAARQAARAAAVHPLNAQNVAATVALRSLGPHLPPIPILEASLRVGDMPLYQGLMSVLEPVDFGALNELPSGHSQITEAPTTTIHEWQASARDAEGGLGDRRLPGLLASTEAKMPVWLVWVMRAYFYEQLDANVSSGSGDDMAGATGFHPRPVVTETRVRLQKSADALTVISGALTDQDLMDARGRGDVTVTVRFQYPLRIPLAKKFFDNSGIRGFSAHRIERSASFPIMYSPGEKEEAVN